MKAIDILDHVATFRVSSKKFRTYPVGAEINRFFKNTLMIYSITRYDRAKAENLKAGALVFVDYHQPHEYDEFDNLAKANNETPIISGYTARGEFLAVYSLE